MSEKALCQHMNFHAQVSVGRITEGEAGPVINYMADIRINCADCGKRMQFRGLKPGLDMTGAAVSPDGLEARLALNIEGELPKSPRIKGYSITNKGPHH